MINITRCFYSEFARYLSTLDIFIDRRETIRVQRTHRMKPKNIVRSIFIAAIAAACLAYAGDDEGGRIHLISLDDDIIGPVSAEYITTSIDRAEADGAACLIIELDTPGGLLSSTRTIVKRMMNAKVPIVVYVSPMGARAGSAGVFITLAANIAAMAPSTNIGAAHPVQVDDKQGTSDIFRDMLDRLSNEPKKEKKPLPMEQKILNDTKAWIAAIASERGRNAAWAIKAVEESASVTETEAARQGIIDFVATDMDDLIARIDGKAVKTADGLKTIAAGKATIVRIPKDFRLRWLMALAHPNIAYILLMLGIYGLIFEFTHPGIVFPGVAGAICLILAFFSLQVLPTNYAGVALIALALAMFIAEIKVTSYGLLTIGGILSLLLGSLILFSSPYDFMRVSLPIIGAFTAATAVIALLLIYLVTRSQRRRITTGAEGLIDAEGDVAAWSASAGHVLIHGEIWNARGEEALAKGDKIMVTAVDGMTLFVKKK